MIQQSFSDECSPSEFIFGFKDEREWKRVSDNNYNHNDYNHNHNHNNKTNNLYLHSTISTK